MKKVQKPGAKRVDILICAQCGSEYERKLLRNYQLPRKYCSEACRAKAWREAGNKPCKPPAKPAPKPIVKKKPRYDSVYRLVHERACIFAGLTRREAEGWIDGDE